MPDVSFLYFLMLFLVASLVIFKEYFLLLLCLKSNEVVMTVLGC
ncbi:hypothetical protein XF_0965 [Xylella fastidiosa 9a5c]|uniref:Uncharacterized protein n=1 Tax=Xylella fastidiosa (strain 9a5c) TaxID=160492 RepID=Q9PER3_XYLFA|nr:hypothetical protein XF_0965 [Xylella fastidiosa 9a5c]